MQDHKTHEEYILSKNTFDDTYNQETNRIKVRSKCDWYKHGEESTKFLGLEEKPVVRNQISNILFDNNSMI